MDINSIIEIVKSNPFLMRGIVLYIVVGIIMRVLRKVFGINLGRIGGKVVFALVSFLYIAMQFNI